MPQPMHIVARNVILKIHKALLVLQSATDQVGRIRNRRSCAAGSLERGDLRAERQSRRLARHADQLRRREVNRPFAAPATVHRRRRHVRYESRNLLAATWAARRITGKTNVGIPATGDRERSIESRHDVPSARDLH